MNSDLTKLKSSIEKVCDAALKHGGAAIFNDVAVLIAAVNRPIAEAPAPKNPKS